MAVWLTWVVLTSGERAVRLTDQTVQQDGDFTTSGDELTIDVDQHVTAVTSESVDSVAASSDHQHTTAVELRYLQAAQSARPARPPTAELLLQPDTESVMERESLDESDGETCVKQTF